MEYIYKKENGEEIKVKKEVWCWVVIYNDGKELHQFGQAGTFHRIGEVEQHKIEKAFIYKPGTDKKIEIPWQPGMKIIHKYRNIHPYYLEDLKETIRVYIFGYHYKGENNYLFILPDDKVIASPTDNVDLIKFL